VGFERERTLALSLQNDIFTPLKSGWIRPRDELIVSIAENRGLRKYTLSVNMAKWWTIAIYHVVNVCLFMLYMGDNLSFCQFGVGLDFRVI
jgi:hypothetical protein